MSVAKLRMNDLQEGAEALRAATSPTEVEAALTKMLMVVDAFGAKLGPEDKLGKAQVNGLRRVLNAVREGEKKFATLSPDAREIVRPPLIQHILEDLKQLLQE